MRLVWAVALGILAAYMWHAGMIADKPFIFAWCVFAAGFNTHKALTEDEEQ